MPEIKINIPHEQLKTFCAKYQIAEIQLFGSVLREDFNNQSDVDVLVTFNKKTHYTLFDLVKMQRELSVIFGRNVDLVEKKSIEQSENYIRRKNILNSMVPIYVAG